MPGTTARQVRNVPVRLTSMTARHSSTGYSPTVVLTPPIAALLTRMSTGPRRLSVSASEGVAILRGKLCQHRPGLRLGIDRGLKVGRNLHALAAVVGATPTPVGLGGLDMFEPMLGHAPFLDQPGDVVDIDRAPDAFTAARREALQIALRVEGLRH